MRVIVHHLKPGSLIDKKRKDISVSAKVRCIFVVICVYVYVVGVGSSSLCRCIPGATSQWVL